MSCVLVTAVSTEQFLWFAPSLRHLDLQDCKLCISALSRLEYLTVSDLTHVTDVGFMTLASLASLTHLNITENCGSVTARGVEGGLLTLTSLQFLRLSRCLIDDQGVTSLSRALCQLQSLSLFYCHNVTSAGFAELSSLCRLRSLFISSGLITDLGIAHIVHAVLGFGNFRGLPTSKRMAPECDCSLARQPGSRGLQGFLFFDQLHLYDCAGVTDLSLTYLAKLCRSQKTVRIEHCPNVSRQSVNTLIEEVGRQALQYVCYN